MAHDPNMSDESGRLETYVVSMSTRDGRSGCRESDAGATASLP